MNSPDPDVFTDEFRQTFEEYHPYTNRSLNVGILYNLFYKACMVSDKKYMVIIIFILLHVIFFLTSRFFVSQLFEYGVWVCDVFWECFWWCISYLVFSEFLDLWLDVFCYFWKILGLHLLEYFSCPILFAYTSIPVTRVLGLLMLSFRFKVFALCFSLYFLFNVSDWVIFTDPSLYSFFFPWA